MLTLTRRIGEKIIISDDIICTVLDVQDNHIRLGFIAPSEIEIYREEVCHQHESIEQESGS